MELSLVDAEAIISSTVFPETVKAVVSGGRDFFHDRWDSACVVKVDDVLGTGRINSRYVGNHPADSVEFIGAKISLCFVAIARMCKTALVDPPIAIATRTMALSRGIPVYNLAAGDTFFNQSHNSAAGFLGKPQAGSGHGGPFPIWKCHSPRFRQTTHGICGSRKEHEPHVGALPFSSA